MGNQDSAYRPHVDGLRAIAVSLVVLYHAFPEQLPGGFIGVDIFFVISGYLITGIIARDVGGGRFDLLEFYARRARRIFPALLLVLCATMAAGYRWMLPDAYRQLGIDTFASAAFSANIALMLQSGYFDVESAKKPLLHLWSLGIEEQFYVLWPLILTISARLGASLFRVSLVLGLALFLLNLSLVGSYPVLTFYLPFTRAFELLAGAALAIGWRETSDGRWHDPRALAGALLIAFAAGTFDSTVAFPGWRAALPAAGSVLLLSAPGAWGNRFILASRPMVRIGLISYPYYLWHWPLLVFFAMVKSSRLTDIERGLTICLSMLLAWATYRLVEIPIRRGNSPALKARTLAACMAVVAAAGVVVIRWNGFDARLPPEVRAIAFVATDATGWRINECLLDLGRKTEYAEACVERKNHPIILLWGDSTAGALLPGLRSAQETRGFGIAQFTANSCIPALDGPSPCRDNNARVLEIAAKLAPDIVLLHAYWGINFDGVADLVVALKQRTHARVVVLGRVPVWRRGLPSEVLWYYLRRQELIPERSSGGLLSNWQDAVMRQKLEPLGAEFISAWDVLCDTRGCLTRTGPAASDLAYSDNVHIRETASILLVAAVIDKVLGGTPRLYER
ncbi:acyltransferase family protein [Bradyrhizobium sp. OK095]|uniref:acyltransferase family protein n=1 Tax=Bradyrhizobium sp. OK095 TaxID=1882760 RepID=UPI0008D54C1D|nr:acyltransferase family protein [Bradyrhizobium sp. OK095]SEN33902.1 Peptidoglycan/LPS O-acetylase OafA/YrhL, contains acyltransferase and SGNH-hydrolase domains [Bradyrhizobium sp. OK095]